MSNQDTSYTGNKRKSNLVVSVGGHEIANWFCKRNKGKNDFCKLTIFFPKKPIQQVNVLPIKNEGEVDNEESV
ncbi:hypothetical protein GCM10027085_29560 [Spirosoma aerophilum]